MFQLSSIVSLILVIQAGIAIDSSSHEFRRHQTYSAPNQYSRYHRFEDIDFENDLDSSAESIRRSTANNSTKGNFYLIFFYEDNVHLWIVNSVGVFNISYKNLFFLI